MQKIKVLIVDDSALFRRFLSELLTKDKTLSVVGTAADAHEAANKVISLKPDVITLDVEMPGISGITFLKKLMQTNPLPVVMVSSYTEENSHLTIEALTAGAVDFALKPVKGSSQNKDLFAQEIIKKIKTAALSRIKVHFDLDTGYPQKRKNLLHYEPAATDRKVIAIGASTGGTRAVYKILCQLPANIASIVVVQHMAPQFTPIFAQQMDELCPMSVKEAENRDFLHPGQVLIAPGDKHIKLESHESGYRVRLLNGPPVNFYKPSIDVFFQSVSETVGHRAVGVILSGMGTDGAKGLLAMRKKGAYTIAQDQETSLIFGMPKSAIKLGAPCEVVPIDKIPQYILAGLSKEKIDG